MGSNFFNVITDTTTQQSIELATALAQIQASGGSNAIAQFSGAQRASLMRTIMQEHSDTAAENIGDLARSQDSLNNVMYYYSRNNDVNNIQSAILDRARSEAQGSARDSQLSKRQFEINEWTASNKAETLFMMQLLLIAVTFTIFMLFLNRMDIIPTSVFSLITALVFIAFIFTFVVRYQYTNYTRDGRYWNRKNYGNMSAIKAPDACPGPDSSSSTLSDLLGEFGDNAAAAFDAYNQFTSNVGRSVSTASAYYTANTGSNAARYRTGSNAR